MLAMSPSRVWVGAGKELGVEPGSFSLCIILYMFVYSMLFCEREKAMEEKLLTTEEVAARLHTTANTVRIWLRGGKLTGYRLGSARFGWRIKSSDVDSLLAEVIDGKDKE